MQEDEIAEQERQFREAARAQAPGQPGPDHLRTCAFCLVLLCVFIVASALAGAIIAGGLPGLLSCIAAICLAVALAAWVIKR